MSLFASAFGGGREEHPAPLENKSTAVKPASFPGEIATAHAPSSASETPAPERKTVQEAIRDLFSGSEPASPDHPGPVTANPPQTAPANLPPLVPAKLPPTPVSALPMGASAAPSASKVRVVVHEEPVLNVYRPATVTPAAPVPPAVPAPTPVDRSVASLGRAQPAPVPPVAPRAPVPAATWRMTGEMTAQCLATLKNSADPFQREDAVRRLSYAGPGEVDVVVRALLDRATKDEGALVRAACLRSLMSLNVKNARVLVQQVAQQARGDSDPRVQIAAREVLAWLGTDKGLVNASPSPYSPSYR